MDHKLQVMVTACNLQVLEVLVAAFSECQVQVGGNRIQVSCCQCPPSLALAFCKGHAMSPTCCLIYTLIFEILMN